MRLVIQRVREARVTVAGESVGEIGAGKSTLANILAGILPRDGGEMLLDGVAYTPQRPEDARRAGIAFVHQELNLFTNLSVAENLLLADFPRRRALGIHWNCFIGT